MNRGGRILRLALLLATVLGAAACQRAADEVRPIPRNVSLLHYFSFSGTFADTMNSVAAEFNRANPDNLLTATPLDHESFKTSIRDDLRVGNTADIYSYWAGARTQSILGELAPLDDVLSRAELEQRFSPAVLESAATYRGRIYLLPVTQHFVGFFYNKKIFAAHGLVPPTTWSEFVRLNQKLKARGVVPVALGSKAKWPAQFWFDYLLLRTAPLDYRQKLLAGQAAYTDAEVVRVFALWRGLIKSGSFNPRPNELEFDSGAALMVYRGEAAMTLMGTWLIGYFGGPDLRWREDSDYGFFPFPQIDPRLPPVALGPIDGLVVPRKAKNPAGAKTVLRHFAGSDVQQALSRGTGAIAPNRSVSASGDSPLKSAVRAEIGKSSAWAFNYDLATPPQAAEIGLNLFAEFMEFPDQYPKLLDKAEARMKRLRHDLARAARESP